MKPIIVKVIVEGQTEEQFIKQVIRPHLKSHSLVLVPEMMGMHGGNYSYARLKDFARRTLAQSPDDFVSTFADLYALPNDFPEFEQAKLQNGGPNQASFLQQALRTAIEQETQCRPGRFVPHIQPYEIEALLFSDINVLSDGNEGWKSSFTELQQVLRAFATPEHINGSPQTHPSKRLENRVLPVSQHEIF